MAELKTKNLVQAIIDDILDQIKKGELRPGDTLPSQRQFIEIYNVGRSSIREAFKALTFARIVEIKTGK
jgi:GntR family transcriptional repressor for pyruvate dehydrogenase complex